MPPQLREHQNRHVRAHQADLQNHLGEMVVNVPPKMNEEQEQIQLSLIETPTEIAKNEVEKLPEKVKPKIRGERTW